MWLPKIRQKRNKVFGVVINSNCDPLTKCDAKAVLWWYECDGEKIASNEAWQYSQPINVEQRTFMCMLNILMDFDEGKTWSETHTCTGTCKYMLVEFCRLTWRISCPPPCKTQTEHRTTTVSVLSERAIARGRARAARKHATTKWKCHFNVYVSVFLLFALASFVVLSLLLLCCYYIVRLALGYLPTPARPSECFDRCPWPGIS